MQHLKHAQRRSVGLLKCSNQNLVSKPTGQSAGNRVLIPFVGMTFKKQLPDELQGKRDTVKPSVQADAVPREPWGLIAGDDLKLRYMVLAVASATPVKVDSTFVFLAVR